MTHYSEEFKASIAARLLPPNNARVADVVKETGVPKDTLYEWRTRYRNKQGASPYSGKPTNQYSADDKLAVIIETATLNIAQPLTLTPGSTRKARVHLQSFQSWVMP